MNKRHKNIRHLVDWEGEAGINLTPLLDMIFNLIFFFILATTIRQTQAYLDVRLPRASEARRAESQRKTVVLIVTKENHLYLNDRQISADVLEKELKSLSPHDVDQIILKGDAMAHHETIVRVLDACAKAGHVGVSVEVKKD